MNKLTYILFLIIFPLYGILGQDKFDNNYWTIKEMPEFKGGNDALIKYINDEVNYPEKAVENQTEGMVIVAFIVNENGETENIRLLKDIGDGCGQEAIRIVEKTTKQWIPGSKDGENVRVNFNLPIQFNLNKPNANNGIRNYPSNQDFLKEKRKLKFNTGNRFFNKGIDAINDNDLELAELNFTSMIKKNPNDYQAVLNRAVCRYLTDDNQGFCEDLEFLKNQPVKLNKSLNSLNCK